LAAGIARHVEGPGRERSVVKIDSTPLLEQWVVLTGRTENIKAAGGEKLPEFKEDI